MAEKIKKPQTFDRSYRPVVLWLDDLTELVAAMKDNAKAVEISTNEYKFPSIDDLKENFGGRALFQLRIESTNPYAYIDLSRLWVNVRIPPGAQSAQLFYEVDGVLQRCQRKFSFLYKFWWVMSVVVLAQAALHFGPEQFAPIATAIVLLVSTWCLWVGLVVMRRTAVINLRRRSEVRNYFSRNKDQLLTLLIGAIIGIAVTFAGVVLKERFYPSTHSVSAPKQP